MTRKFETVRILGSEVDIMKLHDVIQRMRHWIDRPDGRCHQVIVTGFHGLWEGHKDPEFRSMLNSADLWIPDGIAPVWIARTKGMREACRVPGAELMTAYFHQADRSGYRSYFYGDTVETLDRLQCQLEEHYPGHEVAGTFSPPFRALTPQEDDDVVNTINEARPDVVWVGLGMPKQDRWIYAHKDRLNAPVAIGVGAAFGFLSGKVKRVPKWVGDRGFEWAWRFAVEPKKLWRRDLIDGPHFIWEVGLEMTGLKKHEYSQKRSDS